MNEDGGGGGGGLLVVSTYSAELQIVDLCATPVGGA